MLPAAEIHERELPSAAPSRPPLKVSVLVTLFRDEHAGGHVKCWERFAQAATRQPQLDLTVHFLGQTEEVVPLSDNVRFWLHPPRLSTRWFPFLSQIPAHTDLAGYNQSVASALRGCDVIHSTDAFFSFAETALKVSRRLGIPLVNSVHTDTPRYSRVYTAEIVERICGKGWITRMLVDRCEVHARAEHWLQRRLERHQRHSSFVLVSKPDDYAALCRYRPRDEVGTLRRGVDTNLFHPARRDRAWLQHRFGIPPDRALVLFVGRLTVDKNVRVLAEAVAQLVTEGLPVHLICAGEGPLRQFIRDSLPAHVSCPGVIVGDDLTRLYASVDLMAMPSELEVFSNVAQEALASGLPTVLATRSGMGFVTSDATGIVVDDHSVRGWAEALRALCLLPERRARMARAARELAEYTLPSWEDVLLEDLVPSWQKSAARTRANARADQYG